MIQRFGNPESKHVGGNLGFGDYPNLKLGDPTNTSGVIWGLEIIQISNWVIQRSGDPESKHVGGNLGFGNYQNLKLGDPTVCKS